MSVDAEIVETVDAVLGGEHAARIEQDAARIEELAGGGFEGLAGGGFEGLAYEVFEVELYREAEPILLGMLRKGTLARLALKQCKSRGWKFFVHEDDMLLLRSSPVERDVIMVDVLAEAMRNFRRDLQSGQGWTADYNGARGACSLMSYFIGQCVWVFRRAYVRWARQRVRWARLHAVYDFTQDAANEAGIGGCCRPPATRSSRRCSARTSRTSSRNRRRRRRRSCA
ncbi:hypothetical protein [Streptomyces sp. WAC00263]|uniref:hypothetical protein n=1 Tax=Streptomyces sp. WAC00263 TaxID=1917422 RepID=UPI0015EF4CA0|nr:hypothetical protein [Streptomyces sp. WAC00263]KAF5991777.1 hypothetical protein BOG92_007685 [Streptomyces sp. WAC00263]